MIIISHRGYWEKPEEKNTKEAFLRAFKNGFGIETDVRDYNQNLVISHDIPEAKSMLLDDFFELYKPFNPLTLAINIKADGLQHKLLEKLSMHGIENYFVFDMSVPDTLHYLKLKIKSYSRLSEYETTDAFKDQTEGIWLDEFKSHWITDELILSILDSGKKACIVSPELHKRSFEKEWNHYKEIEKHIGTNQLMLCTDYPQLAHRFFNEKN
jgi:glycerophosphoryl diester phosphodiesterase